MKKTRPKTATNRTNESWNNKYFPIILKQTNQTNKNILSQRNSNNNIIDQNDSILNEEFYSLINVWNDLGVTNEFRNQFKKSSNFIFGIISFLISMLKSINIIFP